MEGVNRPELLPPGAPVPVLDVAGFLTDGQEARIRSRVEALEADTGIRLRVLAQNYPETPGLAIKNYWAVDDNTVVFVADPNTGNILNFNVGPNIDLLVPRVSALLRGHALSSCLLGSARPAAPAARRPPPPRRLTAPSAPPSPLQTFWTRLASKFGTKFYWTENGEDVAIVNAVAAIDNCLREPISKLQCSTLRGELE
jgi:hypothetical protein